jgi:hypothetical protein
MGHRTIVQERTGPLLIGERAEVIERTEVLVTLSGTSGGITQLQADLRYRRLSDPVAEADVTGLLADLSARALASDLADETTARQDADDALTAAVAAEATARAGAVSGEATARGNADALLIPLTQRAAANGVATLDGNTLLPHAQLPTLLDADIPSTLARDAEVATLFAAKADLVSGTVPLSQMDATIVVTSVLNAAVTTAISALTTGAPALLDTLDELAAALGDDPNFAATMTTNLGGKVDKSTLTTDGDLYTRAAGVVTRLTRAALASDTAFTSVFQGLSSELTALAGQTSTSYGRSVLTRTNAAALQSLAGLVPGTDVQAHSGSLDSLAGVTLSANALTLLAHTFAQMRTDLGLVIGTNVQAWDADLDTWATKTAPAGTVVGTSDSQTLTNKTLSSPAVTTPTGIVKGDVGLGNVDNTSDATKNGATATLTNKRVTPRVTAITSSATPTVNTDNADAVNITALAVAVTSMTTNLSGTPTELQTLRYRIKDDGTARAITWGASFVARGATPPTTTVAGKVTNVGFNWNTATTTWDCVAVSTEA